MAYLHRDTAVPGPVVIGSGGVPAEARELPLDG
jgi:hypothetical protein